MTNTLILLERCRATCEPKSKNQLAKLLKADRSLICRWYNGKGYPNGLQVVEIARTLKMREADVLCYIAEDKAKSKHSREHVAKHLPRLLPTVGFALACAVGMITTSYMQALPYITKWSGFINLAIHYAKRLWVNSAYRLNHNPSLRAA